MSQSQRALLPAVSADLLPSDGNAAGFNLAAATLSRTKAKGKPRASALNVCDQTNAVMFILNNCRNYCHAEEYRRFDVFFDLVINRHAAEMEWLYPNAICCVISYLDPKETKGMLLLSFWRYRESKVFESKGTWGFIGEKIGDMIITKHDLFAHPEFKGAFNVDGNFNQFSLIDSKSIREDRL